MLEQSTENGIYKKDPEQNDDYHLNEFPHNCILLVEFEGGVFRIIEPEQNLGSPKQIHVIIPRHCEGTIEDILGNKLAYLCDLTPQITPGMNLNDIPKSTPPRLQKTIHERLLATQVQHSWDEDECSSMTKSFVISHDGISYNAKVKIKRIQKKIAVSA